MKHTIDEFNQRRNDLMEAIDTWLLERAGEQNEEAPLSSESPGLMIDRLSILSLKIFHTEEESMRETASEQHRSPQPGTPAAAAGAARRSLGVSGRDVGGRGRGAPTLQALPADEDVQRSGVEPDRVSPQRLAERAEAGAAATAERSARAGC